MLDLNMINQKVRDTECQKKTEIEAMVCGFIWFRNSEVEERR